MKISACFGSPRCVSFLAVVLLVSGISPFSALNLRAEISFQSISLNTGIPELDSSSFDCSAAEVSADGRFVVFIGSLSQNPSPPGADGPFLQVFVTDLDKSQTSLVSINPDGSAGNGHSLYASVSADGRYVLFQSAAANLVANDGNDAPDIFLRDLISNETILLSATTNGRSGNRASLHPMMTPDARTILVESFADDLIPGDDNGISDLFLLDRTSGDLRRVTASSRASSQGRNRPLNYTITPDGRYVAFASQAAGMVPENEGLLTFVYRHDTQTGETIQVTPNAVMPQPGAHSYNPVLSDNGRFIAFLSSSPSEDVLYWKDLDTQTTRVITRKALGNNSGVEENSGPILTADGRRVYYTTSEFGHPEIFVWNAASNEKILISDPPQGQIRQSGLNPLINGNGVMIAFLGRTMTLTDNSGTYQLYIRDLAAGTTTKITRPNDSGGIFYPALSADGKTVLFQSYDQNDIPGDSNQRMDLFAYRIGPGQLIALTNPRWGETGFRFSVQTESARQYSVQSKTSFESPDWDLLEIIIGNGALQTVIDPSAGAPSKFYRITSE
jgi:Tol biopolymer transport system component